VGTLAALVFSSVWTAIATVVGIVLVIGLSIAWLPFLSPLDRIVDPILTILRLAGVGV
jgi:hypothetical protein